MDSILWMEYIKLYNIITNMSYHAAADHEVTLTGAHYDSHTYNVCIMSYPQHIQLIILVHHVEMWTVFLKCSSLTLTNTHVI